MKGQLNPQKLPDGANPLQAEKSDGCIRRLLEMYWMMARDGHWQPPYGDHDNLATQVHILPQAQKA